MDRSNFTQAEERRIRDALPTDDRPPCPRCGSPLERREVPPRDDVPYVRRRIWLVCGACRRSLVVEAPRPS